MLDFMGLSACLMSKTGGRSIFTIGMMKMPGPHNAENIKIAIEKLINDYKFDKSKIIGMHICGCIH